MPASGACWIANTAYSGCQRFVAFVLKQSARRAVFVRQGALPRQVRPGTRSTRICTLGILARLNHKHALCSQQHSLRLSLEQSPPWRRPRRGPPPAPRPPGCPPRCAPRRRHWDLLGWCAGARVCAYILAFTSTSLYSVFRPGQASRASASVSRRAFGRRGVAPAPRL